MVDVYKRQALRCKDTIAPTGTLAQGVGAKQVNSLGEVYETKYGLTTSERVYGTVNENIEGRGPCYLRTEGISQEQDEDLKKAYLNMAPSQTLKWIESGKNPSEQNVEIEGTEPYIVGGHTASGYWIDTERRTTVKGLYAAGDVAGGAPQKYVTGALAEGEIAGLTVLKDIGNFKAEELSESDVENHKKDVYKRQVIQLGTVALPKTGNPAHMKDNANVDFEISDEDMKALKEMEHIDNYGEFNVFPVFSGKPLA